MDLLLILNGKSEYLIKKHGLDESSIHVVKIDEKDLIRFSFIMKFLKEQKYKHIYFGCMEIELQRFISFMFAYIFMAGTKGSIIDELGFVKQHRIFSFIFVIIPGLILEGFAAGILIIYYYIKLPIVKQLYKARK